MDRLTSPEQNTFILVPHDGIRVYVSSKFFFGDGNLPTEY